MVEKVVMSLSTQEEVAAKSLGITPNFIYHFVIKKGEYSVTTGTSKTGEPFSIPQIEYDCEVLSEATGALPEESVKGLHCRLRVGVRKGEPNAAILGYNRGVLEAAGIKLSCYNDTETMFSEIIGQEFDGYVKEDKQGYAYIDANSLRRINAAPAQA